jgi:hypothetical protein
MKPLPLKPEDRYDADSQFPATPWRQRVRNAVLALVTAVGVVLAMLYPPGGVKHTAPAPPPDAARCAAGQDTNCVGGRATVIVAPVVPVLPAAPRASSP